MYKTTVMYSKLESQRNHRIIHMCILKMNFAYMQLCALSHWIRQVLIGNYGS